MSEAAPSGQGVSGEVNEPWRVAAWNACRKQGISQEAAIGFVKALADEMAKADPARAAFLPKCTCHPDDRPSGDCPRKGAASDCYQSRAALSPQGLDAKEGGEAATLIAEKTVLAVENFFARYGGFDRYAEHVRTGTTTGWSQLRSTIWLTSKRLATPSQRLDAATVERWQTGRDVPKVEQRHKDAAAWAMDRSPDGLTWDMATAAHVTPDRRWQMNRVAEAMARMERAALATEPHQHGGKANG